jgi:hypothetical protein
MKCPAPWIILREIFLAIFCPVTWDAPVHHSGWRLKNL